MNGVKFRIKQNSKFCIKDSYGDLKETPSSNILFSTIINNINLLYGDEEAENHIELFKNNSFSISSMFLGLDFYNIKTNKIEKTLYFVPKPEAAIEKDFSGNIEEKEQYVIKRKAAKKIKYISIEALKQICSTWRINDYKFNFDLFALKNIGSNLACLPYEVENIGITDSYNQISIINKVSNPHVSVNRTTYNSEKFYYQEEIIYSYYCEGDYRVEPFMYFMYNGNLTPELKSAINLIVDEGIGGERSTGAGIFLSNEYINVDLPNDNNTNIYIILSAYYPLKDEVDKLLGYKLEKINGYIYYWGGQPFRKRSIVLINEGAIASSKVKGDIVDVTPKWSNLKNNIYCYGKAFSIGI